MPDLRRIVAFRNVLIHGYATIDDALVWQVLRTRVPALDEVLNRLLGQLDTITNNGGLTRRENTDSRLSNATISAVRGWPQYPTACRGTSPNRPDTASAAGRSNESPYSKADCESSSSTAMLRVLAAWTPDPAGRLRSQSQV
jgi:hypothetical protein